VAYEDPNPNVSLSNDSKEENCMILDNKYSTWYFSIIENAKTKERIRKKLINPDYVYYEGHHIFPQSIYPEKKKDRDNLVLLTAKEHYICHLLLCKMFSGPNKHKMINAAIKMSYSSSPGQKRYKSRSFSVIRNLMAIKNSEVHKGIPKSAEHKEKISKSNMGKKMSQEFSEYCKERNKKMWESGCFDNRPRHSQETIEKIKLARGRQVITDEHKKNISKGMIGHRHSPETIEKLKLAAKARKEKKLALLHPIQDDGGRDLGVYA
jgi:hypothetical protein